MQTPQQIKEKIRGMSQKTREIAFSPELFEIIDKISVKNNLNRDQSKLLSDLIFNALVNIADETYLRSNISHFLGNDPTLNQRVSDEVERDIFRNLDLLYQEIVKNNEGSVSSETDYKNPVSQTYQNQTAPPMPGSSDSTKDIPSEKKTFPQSNVGADFEQIILNQAKAMQPAQDSSKQQVVSSKVPENLPSENSEPKPVHDYSTGQDPYREPLG